MEHVSTLAGFLQHAQSATKTARDSQVHALFKSPQEYRKQDVLSSKIVLELSMTKAQNTKHEGIIYWTKNPHINSSVKWKKLEDVHFCYEAGNYSS